MQQQKLDLEYARKELAKQELKLNEYPFSCLGNHEDLNRLITHLKETDFQ